MILSMVFGKEEGFWWRRQRIFSEDYRFFGEDYGYFYFANVDIVY